MRKYSICLIIATFILVLGCGDATQENEKVFHWDLQGIWVSHDPSLYSGELFIEHDRITVSGYFAVETPEHDNEDEQRPFPNIPKGIPHEGYSEDGKIYIIVDGTPLKGIPYEFVEMPDYQHHRMLAVTFGERKEILELIPE